MNDNHFWKDKKVFITGHTGFKGSWLSMWLDKIGSILTGYSLDPPTSPSLYESAKVKKIFKKTIINDIRDLNLLYKSLQESKAEIVFHLAAQSLVRKSYDDPTDTYETNVMGTVNILEAVRRCPNVKAIVIITTDKVYENKEWLWGYRENDRLGGYDPYSNSKACCELVAESFRRSFFNTSNVGIATARTGNAIGGGDWAPDRLLPDCFNSFLRNQKVLIRFPKSIRPWQHVLEPLKGYILLAEKLYAEGSRFSGAWNFAPESNDAKSVEWIVKRLVSLWGLDVAYGIDNTVSHQHEAGFLHLDNSKAKSLLGWKTIWDIDIALEKSIEWVDAFQKGNDPFLICLKQIKEYQKENEIYGINT